MPSYRVLVCGSRNYTNRDKLFRTLDAYHARIGPKLLIISGGATGADELARQWAALSQVDHLILYAKWDIDGKAAGFIRNQRMARKKPRLVLAFSQDFDNSRGTRNMIGVAEKMNIKVKKFS